MIAVPIGPRVQRFATAASPAYLDARGRPSHPRELLDHACLRGRFASGTTLPWEFERNGEILMVDPAGPLVVRLGSAVDLAIDAAVDGLGIIHLFEEWLRPHLDSGALEPILQPWWQNFSGPFLYYPGRRHLPAPLRAFVDFIKTQCLSPKPAPPSPAAAAPSSESATPPDT
jgi:DNA-binding transcriptional LysR family regulator